MHHNPDPPECPTIDELLVRHLESTYPDQCPSLSAPEREVWAAAGRAEVVRYLRHQLEEQQEKALDP